MANLYYIDENGTAHQLPVFDGVYSVNGQTGAVDIPTPVISPTKPDKTGVLWVNTSEDTNDPAVRWDVTQTLTDEQKLRARENIGAIDSIPAATDSTVGGIKVGTSFTINSNSVLGLNVASDTSIDRRTGGRPVDAYEIDYAVKAALTDEKKLAYTDTEKASARETIGAIENISVAGIDITPDENRKINIPQGGKDVLGVVRNGYGVSINSQGMLFIDRASDGQLDSKTANYYPVVPSNLDYAVRAGLLSNTQITDADKPAICQTIGAEYAGAAELLNTIEIDSEGVSKIVVDSYSDGSPLSLLTLDIEINIPNVTTKFAFGIALNDTEATYVSDSTLMRNSYSPSTVPRAYRYMIFRRFGSYIGEVMNTYNASELGSVSRSGSGWNVDKINAIVLVCYVASGYGGFPIGTSIIIRGVRV